MLTSIHAHGVAADRGVGGWVGVSQQNFEWGGGGVGAQPRGEVWVKVLPYDTHRGAPKSLEGAAKKISGRKKCKKSGFLYISGVFRGPLFPTNLSLLLHYEGVGESLGVATRRVGTHSESPKLRPACFSTGV